MAKAKRERRTSIRTMPAEGALSALEALEQAERETQSAGQPAPDRAAEPPSSDEAEAKG
jgi:hypothetical protein